MNGPRNPMLSGIVLASLLAGLERKLREGEPDRAQQNTPNPLSLEEILRGGLGAPGMRTAPVTPAEMEALFGAKKEGPCDCIICTLRREEKSPAATSAPAAADGFAEATQQIAKTFEIGDDVAALVGLTPSMLDDTPDEPATVLRLNAASFISTLRVAYKQPGNFSSIHKVLQDAVEVQVLNAMETALAGLEE